MKNIELLNICYKFFNRFITADILIDQFENIDKSKLSDDDIEKTNKLLNEIKEIANNTSNKVDEYVIKKKEDINNLIKKFEQIPEDDDNSEFLNQRLNNLKKEYNKEIDSQERWFKITDCIDKNDYFNQLFESLTDYELLEFIAQNIQAPFPPNLNQEEFNRLVKVGIEKDEREWLFRLAFNYERNNINFDSIVDYFIKKKDGYYLAELISAVGECLDIDIIFDKIVDKDLIEDLKKRKDVISSYVSEEQFNKLLEKI
ncbi:MAG: hypothetical protein IKN63_04300 [Bacilli bacterium]|nr:hypothetical protein [Bacilli bacterium]